MAEETVTIRSDMRVFHPEYGDITEDVARELQNVIREDHEQLIREAEAAQAAIAAATPGPARICNGFAVKAQIDPRIVAYWRHREGPGFWKHELDNFLKKHPQCRVKQQSDRPTVRVAALPAYRVTGKRGRWAA